MENELDLDAKLVVIADHLGRIAHALEYIASKQPGTFRTEAENARETERLNRG
jgi:hypothetical protein